VFANVTLGDESLTEEDVSRALAAAGAAGFVADLPEGMHTTVGERGARLSGGQRQRIMIARALAHRPRLLVLDEATSALDYESERTVQENMGAISRGRTVLVIAHRLSTVRHCDRIVVIDRGRVTESGTHDDLLELNGYYARLYGYQNHSPVIRELAAESSARSEAARAAGDGP